MEGEQVKKGLLALLYLAVVGITITFFTLPIIAIFTRVEPLELIERLNDPVVEDALLVTLKSSLLAQSIILLLGTPTAYFLASKAFRGRNLLVTLTELPIVLPPSVAGIGLLVAFGRAGLLSSDLFLFNLPAVILAIMLVAGPFYVRQAITAFESVDPNLQSASRTLGAGPLRTFFRVTMPLALGGLLTGTAFSVARGLGEFGATIMFAGSLQGRTQTLTLAIYGEFDRVDGLQIALSISAVLVIISLTLLFGLKLIALRRPGVSGFSMTGRAQT